ncbi:shikimate dehydrogenase family protein [Actinoplanes sp. NPDC051513]|uniref:shikimate dehydrogenase family protein n=1 Tax=Actinoplanes sp. NPDC051513 TaxID=3363908 RepID=UPI0037B0F95F
MGVSTGRSVVNAAFPLWMAGLGRDIRLAGRDLPVGAPAANYRALIAELRTGAAQGAVITSHKVAVRRSAGDLIDWLDPMATECGEVNALRWQDGRLLGFARDPLSIGRVVDEIWPRGEQVICLGAGGSAIALGRHLLSRPGPPGQITFTDRSTVAAEHLRTVLAPWADRFTVRVGEGPWDALVTGGLPGSLVVNATGLGKDLPGSPLSATVRFPEAAVVWDLNYRGDLALLRQARQRGDLVAHDGWQLFCHGWAAALGPILDLPDEVATARRFAALAQPLRPAGPSPRPRRSPA